MHSASWEDNTLHRKMNNRDKENNSTILITGASGFLAGALIQKLLEKTGDRLVLTCRKKELCNRWSKNRRIFAVEADLSDVAPWQNIFELYRPRAVFHLAAVARLRDGEQDPETAFRVNFFGTVNLIKQALKYGTEQFLFTSSDLARDAVSTVGISKYLIERMIIANRHPTLKMKGIRIANLIDGTGSVTLIFRKQIENGEPVTITHPEMSRRFATRREAADDLLWLLEKGKPDSIYVVHKKPLKITDLAKRMMREAGKETEIRFIGARPGEKISEPSYDMFKIEPVARRKLALFKPENYQKENISDFIEKLPLPTPLKAETKKVLKEWGIKL